MARVLDHSYDHPMKLEESATIPLAGGIVQHGYQCGMIWGAAIAAGAQAYQLYGPGPQAEAKAIVASQRLVESFRIQNEDINCVGITDIDKSSSVMKKVFYFFIKGGTIGCFRMAARYAPVAFLEINSVFSEESNKAPNHPVSCTAMLAQKMGLSDMHMVMVAGFAGGIGLSGSACGALGAAVWINAMNSNKERAGKVELKDPRFMDTIDKFLECTDYEFECSEIVGRKFENVNDHADYLCEGGCSKLIEVLATV